MNENKVILIAFATIYELTQGIVKHAAHKYHFVSILSVHAQKEISNFHLATDI